MRSVPLGRTPSADAQVGPSPIFIAECGVSGGLVVQEELCVCIRGHGHREKMSGSVCKTLVTHQGGAGEGACLY